MSKRQTVLKPARRGARKSVEPPEMKTPQLRGDALKARIGEAVSELARELGDRIDPQRVSMKAVAERVPCSRTTLQKYETVVSISLRELGYRAASRTGKARAEALAHRTYLYKEEVAALKAELGALRAHHAEIYGRLLMQSLPVAALMRDDAVAYSHRDGRCLLCGGSPPQMEPTIIVDLSANTSRSSLKKKR